MRSFVAGAVVVREASVSKSRALDELVAQVATAYFAANPTPSGDVEPVIKRIRLAFEGDDAPAAKLPAGRPTGPLTEAQIKASIRPDSLFSFEDGKSYRMLRRHLRGRGLTPNQYRLKWGLPPDYPMAAAEVRAQRVAHATRQAVQARAAAAVTGAEPSLLIGPLRATNLPWLAGTMDEVAAVLQHRLGSDRQVQVLAEPDTETISRFRFRVGVALFEHGGVRHLALEALANSAMIGATRETIDGPVDQAAVARLADSIIKLLWTGSTLADEGPLKSGAAPLHLRMQASAVLFDPPDAPWRTHGEQIAQLRQAGQSEPRVEIMWALHLMGRLIVAPGAEPLSRTILDPIYDEIETIATANLDAIREDPVLTLAVAKLLFTVHRGHEALAEKLTSRALQSSTAFAAALSLMAQFKGFRGDLPGAIALYKEARILGERGSFFEIYLLVRLATAQIAAGRWDLAARCYPLITAIRPQSAADTGLLFLPPGDDGMAVTLKPMLGMATPERAQRAIAYLHLRFCPDFSAPEHQANVLRGPLTHFVRKFGSSMLTDEMWAELPGDLQTLRG
jgi:predicted transcriptional regulator